MVSISKVKKEDIFEVKELLSNTWANTYSTFLPEQIIEKVTNVWHSPELLEAQLRAPDILFIVAKDENEQIIGLATVNEKDQYTIYLNRLYVSPDFQRNGLGTKLLEYSIKAFPFAKKMLLEVEEQNIKGISFYKKQGFQEVERKIEVIEDKNLYAIVMEKTL